jgi:hypothetical protein
VTLSGRIYLIPASPHVLPAFGQGTSVHHQASGGQPGYTYYSNNTAVAVVDASGLVTVRGNGTATISVRDQTAQTKSYTVTVTGVIHCYGFGKDTWPTINNILASNGTRMPSRQELREIRAFYGNRWPGANDYYWSADSAWGFPARYHMVNIISGYEAHVQYYGKYHGVGIR